MKNQNYINIKAIYTIKKHNFIIFKKTNNTMHFHLKMKNYLL